MSNHAVAKGIGSHTFPLLHVAIMGKRYWPRYFDSEDGVMNQKTIIRDLLHRGISPSITNAPGFDLDFPESVKGLSITAQQLAAAFGPEAEAWYMSILRDCGFLKAEEDIARLRELESQGYVSGGHVIGEKESAHEDVSDQGSVHEDRESQNGGSEVGEEDHFWDAEEGV